MKADVLDPYDLFKFILLFFNKKFKTDNNKYIN